MTTSVRRFTLGLALTAFISLGLMATTPSVYGCVPNSNGGPGDCLTASPGVPSGFWILLEQLAAML